MTQALKTAQSVLLVTHVHPDGDAIGSLLGLAHALREQGKQVNAAVDDGVPPYLRFITGWETVLPTLTQGQWDVMVSLDASDEERTGACGAFGRANSATVLNIDHHPTNTRFGDLLLIVPDATSTAEIILEWLTRTSHPLSLSIATALLTGVVTDTRGFRVGSVTAATLGIAQRLMTAGASLADITARTLDSRPYAIIELWKAVLPSVELLDGVIVAQVMADNWKRLPPGDAASDGGLVNFLITADEAVVAVVFREHDGEVDVSMRSKPGFDVSQVALALGGGGHKQAAGMSLAGNLEAARATVLPLLAEVVRRGKAVG